MILVILNMTQLNNYILEKVPLYWFGLSRAARPSLQMII